jgi:hypothetical protein
MKKLLVVATVFVVSMFMISAMALASPSASILYNETDLGGGLWQYDYTFNNTSTASEYLYKVYLDFGQELTATGSPLPSGWFGTMWEGTNPTTYLDAMTIDSSYDIAAGSSLNGFGFTVNYQLGNVAYSAEFDDHAGNISPISGTTAPIVPEPVSSILFLTGGATLAVRRYLRRR